MKRSWKVFYAVSGGLVAAGIVVMLAGLVASGFDARVFTASIDRGTVTLGGEAVENPGEIPLLDRFASEVGAIDTDPA